MKNYYTSTTSHPFHLSVGAVLVNEEKQICCHYFKQFKTKFDNETYEDFYILMRETLENNETLEEASERGILEEFGAKGKIVNYVGSIVSEFNRDDVLIEKTTVYFLINLEECDLSLRKKDDEEKESEIQWHSIDFLISKMKQQNKKYKRTDIDESSILEKVKKMI
jgi:ADP-ribose pyrophosphatase YjhB (NUDIX family)